MNRNRDFFSRPIQGNGRDHHSYGCTRFEADEPKWPGLKFNLGVLALVIAIIAFDLWRVS